MTSPRVPEHRGQESGNPDTPHASFAPSVVDTNAPTKRTASEPKVAIVNLLVVLSPKVIGIFFPISLFQEKCRAIRESVKINADRR